MSSIDPISKTDDLLFNCNNELSCFNMCCHNLNQTLTGFDILKLARTKNISTKEFIKRFAFTYTGKQTGIPVVSLFQQPDNDNACIFLEKSGCSTYDARPLSCRLYPVARGISIDRRTDKTIEHFAIISEDHCKGFGIGNMMTIKDWLKDQDANDYIDANDFFMSLILDLGKNGIKPDKEQKDIIILGCYNSDLFLEKLISGEIKTKNSPNTEDLKNNDILLFKEGVRWTREQLIR